MVSVSETVPASDLRLLNFRSSSQAIFIAVRILPRNEVTGDVRVEGGDDWRSRNRMYKLNPIVGGGRFFPRYTASEDYLTLERHEVRPSPVLRFPRDVRRGRRGLFSMGSGPSAPFTNTNACGGV